MRDEDLADQSSAFEVLMGLVDLLEAVECGYRVSEDPTLKQRGHVADGVFECGCRHGVDHDRADGDSGP